MNKKILVLFLILSCFYSYYALENVRLDFLNFSLGQNIGYLRVKDKDIAEQYENHVNKYIPFSTFNTELVRITKIPFSFSIENGFLFGFKNNDLVNSNLTTLIGNIGFTREYEKNLSYKSGYRSITFFMSGGIISKKFEDLFQSESNNFLVGCQLLIGYLTGKDIYEPIYTKIYFYMDKIQSQVFLYRFGLSLCFDPYYLFRR